MPQKTVKVIVITGATRGLGRAMAERFMEAGHTVLGCGRGHAEVARLTRKFAKPHEFSTVDVSRDEAVQDWAKRVVQEHGAPDLLINNAALVNRNAPLWKVPPDEFQRVMDVNIVGVANCIRHFVPAMVARKSGVIVNFSSGWGRATSPEVAPYCATKWAIEGLTAALAQELPAGMAAIPLNPWESSIPRCCKAASGAQLVNYPSAEEWSRKAVPFLLKPGAKQNGKSR